MEGIVWTRDVYNPAPIKLRIFELELTNKAVCARAKISRNQLYLILNGEPTTEDTLEKVLSVVGLKMDDVRGKKICA